MEDKESDIMTYSNITIWNELFLKRLGDLPYKVREDKLTMDAGPIVSMHPMVNPLLREKFFGSMLQTLYDTLKLQVEKVYKSSTFTLIDFGSMLMEDMINLIDNGITSMEFLYDEAKDIAIKYISYFATDYSDTQYLKDLRDNLHNAFFNYGKELTHQVYLMLSTYGIRHLTKDPDIAIHTLNGDGGLGNQLIATIETVEDVWFSIQWKENYNSLGEVCSPIGYSGYMKFKVYRRCSV